MHTYVNLFPFLCETKGGIQYIFFCILLFFHFEAILDIIPYQFIGISLMILELYGIQLCIWATLIQPFPIVKLLSFWYFVIAKNTTTNNYIYVASYLWRYLIQVNF